MGADYPKNPWEQCTKKDISVMKTLGGCIGEIQGFRAAQKKKRLEVRGPLVLYSTPEAAAFAPRKTTLVPFLSPFRLLLCFLPIESSALSFLCLLYLLFEREGLNEPFRLYGLDPFCQRNEGGARCECFGDAEVKAKRIREEAPLLGPFFQCKTGNSFSHPLAYCYSCLRPLPAL